MQKVICIVQAESTHCHENDEGKVYFCEFGQKKLFRRRSMWIRSRLSSTKAYCGS